MLYQSNRRPFFFLIAVSALFLFFAASAHAAPLNFITAENVTLSSPATTLTIATGSVADAFGVNATSVLVMLSQTTGGTFTLLSPSYDLAVATSSGGGTVTVSCNSGIESAVIAQASGSAIYTIAPVGNTCATASAPIITNVTSTGITPSGATITWTTNIAADSTVGYGTSTAYGATSTNATPVTSHSVALSGLASSTLYHYDVISSENGTSTTSGDNTFTSASNNPATVLVTAPASGATVQGTGVALSATTTVAVGNSITSVQFMIDGSTVGSPIMSAPYNYTWDSTSVTNGSHAVSALVVDSQGHQSTSTAVTITVQNNATSSAAAPTFSPSAGTYSGTQTVTISCVTPSSTVYYTTDGSTPTASSTMYSSPVSISSSLTMNAICAAAGYLNSSVASAAYVIQASSGGGEGIVMAGGSSGPIISPSSTVATTTAITSSSTPTSSLEAEIAALEAELNALLAQESGGGALSSGGAFQFTRNLHIGSTGADVSALQRFLLGDGDYPQGIISGYYGILTERAVEVFQKKKGIVSSGSPGTTGYGMVGPRTRKALNAAL